MFCFATQNSHFYDLTTFQIKGNTKMYVRVKFKELNIRHFEDTKF